MRSTSRPHDSALDLGLGSSVLVAALAMLTGCEAGEPKAVAGPPAASTAAEAAKPDRSFAVIAGPDEPGEPLEVHGVVFQPDGVTPAAGVVVYVYHTGADGRYQRERGAPPRLRAWLVTDAQGRYGYRTIRPASYPDSTISAHVHTQLWSAWYPAQYGTELLFDDDRFMTDEERARSRSLGPFAYVCKPERGADGVLRTTHDLRLSDDGDEFEDSTRHGLRDRPASISPPPK